MERPFLSLIYGSEVIFAMAGIIALEEKFWNQFYQCSYVCCVFFFLIIFFFFLVRQPILFHRWFTNVRPFFQQGEVWARGSF